MEPSPSYCEPFLFYFGSSTTYKYYKIKTIVLTNCSTSIPLWPPLFLNNDVNYLETFLTCNTVIPGRMFLCIRVRSLRAQAIFSLDMYCLILTISSSSPPLPPSWTSMTMEKEKKLFNSVRPSRLSGWKCSVVFESVHYARFAHRNRRLLLCDTRTGT